MTEDRLSPLDTSFLHLEDASSHMHVEGVERGRFAILSKTHHALVDGVSGLDILSVLFAPEQARSERFVEEFDQVTVHVREQMGAGAPA